MPDIAMCQNENCPLREGCYRFTATPDPHYQAYARFNYVKTVVRENGQVVRIYDACEYYMPDIQPRNHADPNWKPSDGIPQKHRQ